MVTKTRNASPQTPGQIVKAYRLEKGLTLDSMAEFLHCSKSELSLFENDRKPIGRMKRLLWSMLVPQWTPEMLKVSPDSRQ